MPAFEPFRGIRYNPAKHALLDVTAPPYDVISPADRARLVDRSPHNAVLIDLPSESDGDRRYSAAAERIATWRRDGSLVTDDEPSFTVYRMGYLDDLGRPAHTLGVIGALALSKPGEGRGILPHEHTTPKAKTDRLDLMRATAMNLSAVWGLSLTDGLTALLEVPDRPMAAWTDEDGVDQSIWRITDPARVAAIAASVASSAVVIADGHHRYETALTYRAEAGSQAVGAEAVMTFVVELVSDQLTVRPIHRLLAGFPAGFDLEASLAAFFSRGEELSTLHRVLKAMDAAGALALVGPDGSARLLHPRTDALAGAADVDSSRLALALDAMPHHEVRYQHGVDHVLRALENREAQYGVLLRPATVTQIAANARAGERMPPKTTYFHPKPKTGLVFRDLAAAARGRRSGLPGGP